MSSSLTEDDLRILSKTMEMRERLVDKIMSTAETMPATPRELDAFVGLVNSMDASVLGKAKIRNADEANKNEAQSKALLADFLLSLHKEEESTPTPEVAQLPEFQSTGVNVLEGEIIEGLDNVGMEVLENL